MPKGFTLIEILIAITILSLAAVVAIPNIKKFGEDQEVKNISSDIARLVRQAQSSGMSGIKCSNGNPNRYWMVRTTYSVGSTKYELMCYDGATLYPEYDKTVVDVSRVAATGSCQSSAKLMILFKGNVTEFWCGGPAIEALQNIPALDLTVQKNNVKNMITVEKGGSITVKDVP
jgi:prepilin-type N-terminal cleavage/methylation domain-containing protein